MKWLFVIAALLLTVLGHTSYKIFATEPRARYLFLTVTLFAGAPLSNFLAIRSGLTVAQVYMATAFLPALTILTGKYWFKEEVGVHHAIGVSLVIVGACIYYS